jgi:hypothetical protein
MSHDAAAAAASGAEIVANSAQGLATGAAAAASVAGLAPAGADEVSAQASAAFSAEGAETLAQLTAAQEEVARAGAAFTTVAGMYSALDDGASDTLD